MKRQILISLLALLFVQAIVEAEVLYVPSRTYPTIQSAINDANPGDVVEVAPGVYTGGGNRDLDFHGDAITVKSEINPDNPNWDIIAATVIDCNGTRYDPHRAFHFDAGEDPNSKVLGFTIRNGYARGIAALNGHFAANPPVPYESIDPDDPNGIPRGELGPNSPVSDGYGGGILCENASSPTIQYCVISNCIVTGGQGGDGAHGQWGTWIYQTPDPHNPTLPDPNVEPIEVDGGQWGGHGGDGEGNGYGGAIACRGTNSKPIIRDCIISDNFARGGCGGNGGDGGWAAGAGDEGEESWGGDGGDGIGDGIGGGLYADNGSDPIIINCTFSNNIATEGLAGIGGLRGEGDEIDPPAADGEDGNDFDTGDIAGGAAYYKNTSDPNFTNCIFTNNKSYYVSTGWWYGDIGWWYGDVSIYTKGGALYSKSNNIVTLDTCEFTGNSAGAVYCENGCILDIDNCLFKDNSEADDGGAVYIGSTTGKVEFQNCVFGGNWAYNDGGALKCRSNITLTNCSFGNNIAYGQGGSFTGYGGGIDVYNPVAHLVVDVNGCSFVGNQAIRGGGFSSENFEATLTDCYFIGNTAEEGGGLDLALGDVEITGGVISGNRAAGDPNNHDISGGGLYLLKNAAVIRDCTISDNSTGGVGACGGAIIFDGNSVHQVKNCLITGNSATDSGGAMYCHSARPEIRNCTFNGNSADSYGGVIFSNWNSEPNIIDSIFQDCSGHAVYEEDYGGNAIVTYCLFHNNPDGDYYDGNDVGEGSSYTGADNINSNVAEAHDNIDGDPLFVSGDLGDYYLSQTAAGLAGWYELDESSGITATDSSGNSYDGTLAGSATWAPTSGKFGGALEPNSTDGRVEIPTTGMSTSAGTVSLWGRPEGPQTQNYRYFFAIRDLPGGGNRVQLYLYQTTMQLGAGLGDTYNLNTNIMTLSTDTWYHIALTWDEDVPGSGNGNWVVYVNGINEDSGTYSGLTSMTTGADIGNDHQDRDKGLSGFIDNVCIWSRTLSASEVQQVYSVQSPYVGHSPAVDAGSADANDPNIAMDTYTTRTDGVNDVDVVDMGYHYVDSNDIELFQLTTSVVGDYGTIEPDSGEYYAGTTVTLTATPDLGWRVKAWSGTDNDSSIDATNTVVMNSDRVVTVEFIQKTRVLYIGLDPDLQRLQDAIAEAEDGDTIVVESGMWSDGPTITLNKSITIRSEFPGDPSRTIFDHTGKAGQILVLGPDTDANTIIDGFTFQNCYWGIDDGDDADDPGYNGGEGDWGYGPEGAAIYIYDSGGPVLKNCIIRNNQINGGDGGDGASADETHNAGRGGWGGWARGGGIYCGQNSSPAFINCQILDNAVFGGDGGDGGAWDTGGGYANYGGLWSWPGSESFPAWDIRPESLEIIPITEGHLWEYWRMTLVDGDLYWDGGPYIGDYRWYTGYGGGIYCADNSTVTFTDCTISGNRSHGGMSGLGGELPGENLPPVISYELPSYGGGVYCAKDSTVTFADCAITDNIASEPNDPIPYRLDPYTGYGGGVCAEETAKVVFTGCTFSENEASVGGGIYWTDANAIISDCDFTSNSAFQGGGMLGIDGQASIIGCRITNNEAIHEPNDPNDPDSSYGGEGGGLRCATMNANIADCNISNNYASASGGGVCFNGGLNIGEESIYSLTNCLLTNNTADVDGGAVSSSIFSQLLVSNCTIVNNTVTEFDPNSGGGGGLYCSYESVTDIINSILWGNSADNGPQIAMGTVFEYTQSPAIVGVTYSDVQGGESAVWVGEECTLEWDVDPNYPTNIDEDPLLINGYYLKQVDAGQDVNSACVDAGSANADDPNIGMDSYTTRTTSVPDDGIVDMGYHYSVVLTQYELTVTVLEDPNEPGIHGIVDPNAGTYYSGAIITLTAIPDDGWTVKAWSGTDDDSSSSRTNTVTMSSNKIVTIEFRRPRTLNIPGEYSSIQEAFDAAADGDTILIATGVYRRSEGYYLHDKAVTITSTNPDDPNIVAATVVEMLSVPEGDHGPAFRFYNIGPDAIINGLTIRGFMVYGIAGDAGEGEGGSGENGVSMRGSAMRCIAASPTIKNCIITDCTVEGGEGGDGADGGGANLDGGHGGWPGRASGGGLACLLGSSPNVINCTFDNCQAIGGDAGDGGDAADDSSGNGGRGGAWYYGEDSVWFGEPWPYAYHIDGSPYDGYYDSYTRYSGLGGAVYVGPGCYPTFTNCTFTGNRTFGGTCGIIGMHGWSPLRDRPNTNNQISNFGGAVYCDTDSSARFIACEFNDNAADTNFPADNDDPYVSFGGAVAFEDGAMPSFENCTFNGNLAAIGGAMYWANSIPDISDCDFVDNSAYHGGGLYFVGSDVEIMRCNVTGNEAAAPEFDDPNIVILGQGGGIYCGSSSAQIVDCDVIGNQADASGGGVYFVGAENVSSLTNCLLTDNESGRDGGGISANWFSEVTVSNCTVANNIVTGAGFENFGNNYGGGLYCSYEAKTNVIDSILWGNSAEYGRQIAIGTGFEFDPRAAEVDVSYSDVQGGQSTVYVDDGCTLTWDANSNIYTTPLFVTGPLGGYYLSQTIVDDPNQTSDSPCVDAGSDFVNALGMYKYTTRTDEVPDIGTVDMGYHYPSMVTPCSFCDLSGDGFINIVDLAVITSRWLDEGCSSGNGWCDGADLDRSGKVDFSDFAMFAGMYASCLFAEDTDAPVPNPSEWKTEPYSVSATPPYLISMTAKTTFDGWGGGVQYYFECVYGDCSDSGWQDEPNYTDTDLDPNTEYGYRVRAKDLRCIGVCNPSDPNDPNAPNKTDWSVVRYAITGVDTDPPSPSPMEWLTMPYATSPNSIAMVAATATDASGVEYYFDCYLGDCNDSGWQDEPNYTNPGLAPETTYTYRVRARDKSINQNQTDWSDPNSATTLAEGEEPNEEPPPAPNILDYGQRSVSTGGDKYNWYHWLTVSRSAEDATGVDEFRFVCITVGVFSSDWVPIDGDGIIGDEPGEPGYPDATITYLGDTITYDRIVKQDSYLGESYDWRVDASNAYGQSQSGVVTVPPPP